MTSLALRRPQPEMERKRRMLQVRRSTQRAKKLVKMSLRQEMLALKKMRLSAVTRSLQMLNWLMHQPIPSLTPKPLPKMPLTQVPKPLPKLLHIP
jgi:hypothetical protein